MKGKLPAAFYDSVEEYDMPDKRTYKEVLVAIEAKMTYVENHLSNIDHHLERQNDKLFNHGKDIAKNSVWICALKYALYIIFVAVVGAITTTRLGLW